MTVKELIELNDNIGDLTIEVRDEGGKLIKAYHIGKKAGVPPVYPKEKEVYIEKNINMCDDGSQYIGLKLNRIPKSLLNLTVKMFKSHPTWHGYGLDDLEHMLIWTFPDGYDEGRARKEIAPQIKDEELEGQMQIEDFPEVMP